MTAAVEGVSIQYEKLAWELDECLRIATECLCAATVVVTTSIPERSLTPDASYPTPASLRISLGSVDSTPLSSLRSSPVWPFSDEERIKSPTQTSTRSQKLCVKDSPSSKGLESEALENLPVPRPRKRSKVSPYFVEAPQKKPIIGVSPYFPQSPQKKPKTTAKVSCIPFPPLTSTTFGLVQERLAHDPFRLLIAATFLNKTRGSVALPVFYELMERYPTPADLATADQQDVVDIIQHLGLQNQRAATCINLAKAWLERPPDKTKRYRVLHYPKKDDGKDVKVGEIIGEDDERVAWEIGQLPGCGAYAMDSWRIFCRDELRGLTTGLPKELTEEAKEAELRKEWARVLPLDKELRAYLRWRWLRNGWEWDPITGERKLAEESELAKAHQGGVIYEGETTGVIVGEGESKKMKVVKEESENGKNLKTD